MAVRGVWQLQNLLIRYQPLDAGAKGVTDFVRSELVSFAKTNPQIAIQTANLRGTPRVTGTYLNGNKWTLNLHNKSVKEVQEIVAMLRNQDGDRVRKYLKPVEGSLPSIQGIWDPSTKFSPIQLKFVEAAAAPAK